MCFCFYLGLCCVARGGLSTQPRQLARQLMGRMSVEMVCAFVYLGLCCVARGGLSTQPWQLARQLMGRMSVEMVCAFVLSWLVLCG